MKWNVFGCILGISAAVGAGVVVKEFVRSIGGKESGYSLADFGELLKKQKTVDELNAGEIADWIKETKECNTGELTYILAYPTKEIISKYRLKGFPDDMDREHNMIFLAVRKDTYMPVRIQLISFGSINGTVADGFFKGTDYAVVEE